MTSVLRSAKVASSQSGAPVNEAGHDAAAHKGAIGKQHQQLPVGVDEGVLIWVLFACGRLSGELRAEPVCCNSIGRKGVEEGTPQRGC